MAAVELALVTGHDPHWFFSLSGWEAALALACAEQGGMPVTVRALTALGAVAAAAPDNEPGPLTTERLQDLLSRPGRWSVVSTPEGLRLV